MFTEKHILGNPYNNHQLSRTVTGYEVTTVDCSADKSSGWNGSTVNLEPLPAWNQKFSGWGITGGTLTGSAFKLVDDTTAQAKFETAKNVTLQTDGNGTINSTKRSGFINDTATLSNVPAAGYSFSGYTITGSILTGSAFKFTGSNVTAKAWFSASLDSVTIGSQTWLSKNLSIDDGGTGIYKQTVNYGQGDVEECYYTYNAALRIANAINGWHLPNSTDWATLVAYASANSYAYRLKSTYGWTAGNGTDTYGFAAFPAGYHGTNFTGTGTYVDYWQSANNTSTAAYCRDLSTGNVMQTYSRAKSAGLVVRLIKDT